jgi:dienelactone hydrolase
MDGGGTMRQRRRDRRKVGALAVLVALAAFTVACVPPPAFSTVASGSPGADGPCVTFRSTTPNPADPLRPLVVVEPAGTGSPWTGGTCDDRSRPVVLIAHGWTGGSDALYEGLIRHLAANGFVVAFQPYQNEFDWGRQYGVVDAGFQLAVQRFPRVDTRRIGVVGHSLGGGMAPWLLRRAADRGWGTTSTWAVLLQPWFAQLVGSGPLGLPAHARLAVVAAEEDNVVDARIGIELLQASSLAPERRVHVTVRSDRAASPVLTADHLLPLAMSGAVGGHLRADHLDRWAVWRTIDAVAGCSLVGRWCDADLAGMGQRSNGAPVTPAVVSRYPVDSGPLASQECTSSLNPRSCPTP